MLAQADTNCHNIFIVMSATQTHLAKIGATCHVVPTCRDMSATFPAKLTTFQPLSLTKMWESPRNLVNSWSTIDGEVQ